MLVLFDIDGTLLVTDGAGRLAMEQAASEVLGRPVSSEGIRFGGALDPRIWEQLCARAGVGDPGVLAPRFRRAYGDRLLQVLRHGAARALPGVTRLLDALKALGVSRLAWSSPLPVRASWST